MLIDKLKDIHIILASGSPRRQNFFRELGLNVTIDVREIDETYPPTLSGHEISDHIAELKALAYTDIPEGTLVITSDTIVWKDGLAIGKPKDIEEAKNMLQELSGSRHEVITSVCFKGSDFQKTIHDKTEVWFKELDAEEIDYYVTTFKPFDKAGSYGIQEWIGYIGIERIEGSFFNVMGLPTHLVYKTLRDIAGV